MLVFDQIMKYPEVLADFVYVYKLKLREVHLIKDMIHPDRKRDDSGAKRLQVFKHAATVAIGYISHSFYRTEQKKNFFLRYMRLNYHSIICMPLGTIAIEYNNDYYNNNFIIR